MSFRRGLYSVFLYLILPFVLVKLLWRSRSNPDFRKRIPERLGFSSIESNLPIIWLHTVSVGEAIAAKPLIELLLKKYSSHRVLVTTTTPTGSDQVRSMFADRVSHVYIPYDLPDAVGRFLNRIKPDLLIVMETEIWPNLYAKCQQREIPIIIVNARLSEKSAKSYLRIKGLIKETLARVNILAVRSEKDGERFKRLGATEDQIEIVGNLKFDVQRNQQQIAQGKQHKHQWGEHRAVWVAASTHRGEDEIILHIFQQLLERIPDLLLILVPRHPERFEEVDVLCSNLGLAKDGYVRHSEQTHYKVSNSLVLGDSMGELQSWYAVADVVFIGGSLVNRGGHNPLEATALEVPVVSGKYMFNFDDIAHQLTEEGLLTICENQEKLQNTLYKWLDLSSSIQQKNSFKKSASKFVQQHRGVTERLDQLVSKLFF